MKRIYRFFLTYITFFLLFVIQKPIFFLATHHTSNTPISEPWLTVWQTMMNGTSLDASMSGYLCVIPGLLLIASIYLREEIARFLWNGYMTLAALLVSITFLLNIFLYPYWHFPLDSTPLFYFLSSPADALASTSIWVSLAGILLMLLISVGVWFLLRWRKKKVMGRQRIERHRSRECIILLLLTALLFIPIRGGFTVSTTNTGQVYFSPNTYVNHVAVNPLFSFIESLSHQDDFGSQYRFMDEKEAGALLSQMTYQGDEDTYPILNQATRQQGTPDILFVIMEGFASDLMPSMGTQKDVAVELDSIAQSGILFTNFYANSFRTDRGLVAILSGFPAQPMHSIMKYPSKSAALPSFARTLVKEKKYKTAYYYGGDVNFTNQRSFLVSQGYQTIISDKDFPLSDKLSKWGVPDHILANRLMADIEKETDKGPWFRVMQTSSSHEPFDVPYSRLKDKRLNAFAYTDSVVGSIMRRYSKLPQWKNTLVVLVPDHVGGYKEHLDNYAITRYQIPLILTGGAIDRPMKIRLIGSQHDIAATLLGQLGLAHKDFLFSKNMLSSKAPKFAFFTVPDAFGMVTDEAAVIHDNKQNKLVYQQGKSTAGLEKQGKAYLQKLYDTIAESASTPKTSKHK